MWSLRGVRLAGRTLPARISWELTLPLCGPVAYPVPVPRYEYRCRSCGATFEQTRPMSQANSPATCPQGHDDTVKLLSMVSLGGRASTADSAASGPSGGCCGGACGCR
ncbi:MAG TPA: zinc ribbon domain-containing protein [Actinopolymorphaceae bacterium]